MSMTWDTERYNSNFSFVYNMADAVFNMLSPQKGESILDIGCGTGELTSRIRDAGAETLGIDASPIMIEGARKRFPDMRFELIDALCMPFDCEFDAIFSNAALHWIKNQDGLTAGIYRALKPGGRFVCEFGGKNNCKSIFDAYLGNIEKYGVKREKQWYNPSVAEYSALLEKHGLTVCGVHYTERKTELFGPDGLRNWIDMFLRSYLDGFSDSEKKEILDKTVEDLRARLYCDGKWYADYIRIRVLAKKLTD